MTEMSLREVCDKLGVSRRAIQGYEKAQLVSASSKTESGYLLYGEIARERIKLIKLYQDMGFSIKEIKTMIDAPAEIKKAALINRKEKLNENIQHTAIMIEIIQEMLRTL